MGVGVRLRAQGNLFVRGPHQLVPYEVHEQHVVRLVVCRIVHCVQELIPVEGPEALKAAALPLTLQGNLDIVYVLLPLVDLCCRRRGIACGGHSGRALGRRGRNGAVPAGALPLSQGERFLCAAGAAG